MNQNELDRLLDAMARGTLTGAERTELDRRAAADPGVARQRDAELLIVATLSARAAAGLSGARTPDASLLAQIAATPPLPPVRSFPFVPVALGAVVAGAIGVIIGTTLLAPSPVRVERPVVRHDTVVRIVPAPSLAQSPRGVSPSFTRAPQTTAPMDRPGAIGDGNHMPRAHAPQTMKHERIDARPEDADDDQPMVSPELRTTDTVRSRARFDR